ncbi:MAG: hypothetical protein WBP81_38575 [Solirubrobacteraceae bacterium]
MAFFDPVDPSTESLLWPGRVGFCIVAAAGPGAALPLSLSARPKGKSNRRRHEARRGPGGS